MFIDVRKVYGANDTRSTFSFSLQLSENSAKLIEHEIILYAGVNYIVCRYAVCIYTLCRAGTGSGGGQCNHFAAMLGWWSGGAIHQMWTPAHCEPLCALQLSPHHCRWSIHMFYGHKAGGGVCEYLSYCKQ